MRKRKSTSSKLSIGLVCFVLFLAAALRLYSQDVDPFYLRSLSQGEKLYLSAKYREALKKFEIAAFGFIKEKPLRTKALLLSSLCSFHLKNYTTSEAFMRNALELSGDSGFAGLNLPPEITAEVDSLVIRFKFKKSPAKKETKTKLSQTTPPSQKKPAAKPAQGVIKPGKESAKKLEKEIKGNLRKPSLYYRLYAIYRESGKTKNARKTLQKLIRYNPHEIKGYVLLSKLEFRLHKYKASLNYCRKILESSSKNKVTHETINAAFIYSVLCNYHLNRISTAKSLLRILLDIASKTEISNIIQADGLDQEWEKLIRVVGKEKKDEERPSGKDGC